MKGTSTLQHLAKAIEWALFIALIPLFFIIVSPLLPTKEYLTTYAVVSGSMAPIIPVGTLALVSQKAATQLTQGDVIAFPEPGNPKRIVLHRVTGQATSGTITEFKTKGDANQSEDPWSIPSDQVRGKMISMIPMLGYLVIYAQKPLGFALAVGVPAAIIIALQIKNIKEGIDEEVQKRAARVIAQHQATQE